MYALFAPPTRTQDGDRPSGSRNGGWRRSVWSLPASMLTLGGAVWLATRVEVSPTVHEVALFAHLAALVAGFGAVLAVDWAALAWVRGRTQLEEVLTLAARLAGLIWLGLAGLVVTGIFLGPDPSVPRTAFKLVLVAVLTCNGHVARHLHTQLERAGLRPPAGLLARAVGSATVSQICWWGATVIGFLNARS